MAALYERMVAEARAAGRLPAAAREAGELPSAVLLAPIRWYVLTVTPMCEQAVSNRLKRRVPGIVTYWPVARRRVKRAGRYESADWLPMPRYLFVGFPSDPPWLWVSEVQGVQSVLGMDETPCEVAPTVIGNLIWRCETGQLSPLAMPMPQRGMQVVARRGVMAGFEGVVRKVHKQQDLVEVFFDMVGSIRPITMRIDHVAAVCHA